MSLVFQKILVGYNFNERYSTQHNMNHLHVWEEYKNLCLEKINHGDDLYMIVWDTKTEQPKEVKYGSYSVNSFSKFACYVDALPEFIEKYERWKSDQVSVKLKDYRSNEVSKLLSLRRAEINVLKNHNFSIKYMRTIYDFYGYDLYMKLLFVLCKSFRNHTKKEFKRRLIKMFETSSKLSYYDLNLLKGIKL